MTFSIVYTLSDRRDMPQQILKSLESLSCFVNKQKIFVFYTPPRSSKTERKLEKYATIIKTENTTTPFIFDRVMGLGNYGEKIHLCEIDTSSVIFLDCDTIIKKDVTELLPGTFDFSGRMGRNREIDWDLWKTYCMKHNKAMRGIFNTGFMIFKNGMHHKIKAEWKKFIEADIPKIHPYTYTKEEYALSLVLPHKNIKFMTEKEHAFGWKGESNADTYVLHGYPRTRLRRLHMRVLSLKRKIMS